MVRVKEIEWGQGVKEIEWGQGVKEIEWVENIDELIWCRSICSGGSSATLLPGQPSRCDSVVKIVKIYFLFTFHILILKGTSTWSTSDNDQVLQLMYDDVP